MAVLLSVFVNAAISEGLDVHKAAEMDQVSRIKEWIASGPVDVRDSSERTPLWYACSRGALKTARLLLDAGADPNIRDRFEVSPLTAAVKRGHADVVDELIKSGADPNPETRPNFVPLHTAIEGGHDEIVVRLLSAGADPLIEKVTGDPANDLTRNAIIRTRIRGIAQNRTLILGTGHPSDVVFPVSRSHLEAEFVVTRDSGEELLRMSVPGPIEPPRMKVHWDRKGQAGKEIGPGLYVLTLVLPDGSGSSSTLSALPVTNLDLVEVAPYTTSDVIQSLLMSGTDPDRRGYKGRTALMMAAAFGNEDVVVSLLSHGADPALRDPSGLSAFDYAERYAPGQVVGAMLRQAMNGLEIRR